MSKRSGTKGDLAYNRAQSQLNVSSDYYLNLPIGNRPPSPAVSAVTLTPSRLRNIDQDMEALRQSRQDNPFLKQVIASRESLADCLDDESDDTNLMAQEFNLALDVDPLSLPEVHDHMIRSPPPTNWPRSPNHRVFSFPEESLQVEVTNPKEKPKKHSSWEGADHISPLKGLPKSYHHHPDKFSLLRTNDDDSIRLMSDE